MKNAFIPIITLTVAIAVFSCNDDPYKSVDSSKIIGQEIDARNLPYQTGKGTLLYDHKYIDGRHYRCLTAEYKNNVIAYLFEDDDIITDYFFSKAIRIGKAEKIPIGTSYEEVVKIFGEPVFLIYPGIPYKFDDWVEYYNSSFYCDYYFKKFDKFTLKYELNRTIVRFYFDNHGKLNRTASKRQVEK